MSAHYRIERWKDGDRQFLTRRGWAVSPLRYEDRETAESYAKDHTGDPRVTRWTDGAEREARAKAEALRELAAHYRYTASILSSVTEPKIWNKAADEAERRADALWSRKGLTVERGPKGGAA